MSNPFSFKSSLVLNCVLAAVTVGLGLLNREPVPASASPSAATNGVRGNGTIVEEDSGLPHYSETGSASDQRRWLIDQLRSLGVPNHTLARIVQASLDAQWTKHTGEVAIKCHGDPDTMAALQLEIDKSTDAEMRAALGDEGFAQWDRENMQREANAGNVALSPTETEAAYKLWKALETRELELKEARVRRTMDEADIEDAHTLAYNDYKHQMSALMGDERYAKSQQTDAGTAATNLKQDLAAASPNDSQFQALLKSQQQLNERQSALDKQFQADRSSPAYAEQLKALNEARDQEYQRVLGPSAFDTLQKSQDTGYAQMKKNQALWGLDDEAIDNVYGTVKYYEKALQEYESEADAREARGQSVDRDAVNASVAQFSAQTRESLKNYLGEDRFNRLQRNGIAQFNGLLHH